MITAGMDVPNAEVASNTINTGACWMKARNCALCTYTRRTLTVIAIGTGNVVTPAVEAVGEAGAEAAAVEMMDADPIFETTEGETMMTVGAAIQRVPTTFFTLGRRRHREMQRVLSIKQHREVAVRAGQQNALVLLEGLIEEVHVRLLT